MVNPHIMPLALCLDLVVCILVLRADLHIVPLTLCLDLVVCILGLIVNPHIMPSALCLDLVDISFGPLAQKRDKELQVYLTFILKIYCMLHTYYTNQSSKFLNTSFQTTFVILVFVDHYERVF